MFFEDFWGNTITIRKFNISQIHDILIWQTTTNVDKFLSVLNVIAKLVTGTIGLADFLSIYSFTHLI